MGLIGIRWHGMYDIKQDEMEWNGMRKYGVILYKWRI